MYSAPRPEGGKEAGTRNPSYTYKPFSLHEVMTLNRWVNIARFHPCSWTTLSYEIPSETGIYISRNSTLDRRDGNSSAFVEDNRKPFSEAACCTVLFSSISSLPNTVSSLELL